MRQTRFFSFFLIICSFSLFLSLASAQEYIHEIGGGVGASFYMGDANRTKIYSDVGPSVGLMHRYNFDFNWSLKSNLVVGSVSGDTRNTSNVFPNFNEYSFKRTFFELGSQVEYNLFRYSDKFSYLDTRGYTPYLFTGIGVTLATGDDLFFNVNVPIGLGFKYKIKERLNVGVEFSMRKLFGDDFDVTNKSDEWSLDSPYGIKSSFIKNKDWYSVTMFFVTWEFGAKHDPCCGGN